MARKREARLFATLAIGLLWAGPSGAGIPVLLPTAVTPAAVPIAETKTKKEEKVEHFFKASKIYGLEGASVQKGAAIRAAAGSGDAEAQFRLAEALRQKAGQQKLMPPAENTNPLHEAIAWYEKAAAQGHVQAKQRLADLYVTGDGVEPDPAKALRLYREAASQGDSLSALRVGRAYEEGIGTERNLGKAIDWYEQTSKRTDRSASAGEARYRLGKIYLGDGTDKADFVRAYMWLDLAAKSGHRSADGERLKIERQMSLDDIVQAKRAAREWSEALD
ncbi:MAG: sel1 repeat family protein [Alphaproteobacteria bacterium]|nr:sel1 repeat family protein [Alphaproteobacteria bacterium]